MRMIFKLKLGFGLGFESWHAAVVMSVSFACMWDIVPFHKLMGLIRGKTRLPAQRIKTPFGGDACKERQKKDRHQWEESEKRKGEGEGLKIRHRKKLLRAERKVKQEFAETQLLAQREERVRKPGTNRKLL